MEGGGDLPARPGQGRTLHGSQGRAAKDELEGEPKATLGCVLAEGPWPPAKASRTQDAAGWGCGGKGKSQGQTVSPQGPAAHGVPAGLGLQAYPGEKGTERGLRGSTSISFTGWQVLPLLPSQAASPEGLWFPQSSQLLGLELPGQGLTFMPSGPLSPGGPMSPGNP